MHNTTVASTRFSNDDAAEYLGVKPGTLACWRSTGRHLIPYIRVGARIMYRREELDRFLEKRTVRFEEETAPC